MRKMIGAALVTTLAAGCGTSGNAVTPERVIGTLRGLPPATAKAGESTWSPLVTSVPRSAAARPATERAQAVSAAQGGLVRSVDGVTQVVIPPGALSRNTVVKVQRRDTAGKDVTKDFVPGLAFQLDLGGAQIAPGASVMVTGRVDARFVDAMRDRHAGFSPDAYGLRQEADGAWLMTMPVHGPALMPVAAPQQRSGWAPVEQGVLPLPAGKQVLTADPAPRSTAQDCATFKNFMGFGVPSDWGTVHAAEDNGVFVCDGIHLTDWFENLSFDVYNNLPTCQAGDDPTTPAPIGDPMAVWASVRYDSDDRDEHNKPVPNAKVRYEFISTPVNGPSDVAADERGMTNSFTLAGLSVALTAYTDKGEKSARVVVRAVPDMSPVPLLIRRKGFHGK